MKNIIFPALCGAIILAGGCSTAQKPTTAKSDKVDKADKTDKPEQSDMAALQGSWKGRVIQENPHQCNFVVSGKNFEFHDETDANVWYKGTFSLREDTTPRQFIARVSECAYPQYVGQTSMAIYRIQDGTLTITANEPGNPAAPTAFDAPDLSRMEVTKK